jgi:serine O-acetyltransferase
MIREFLADVRRYADDPIPPSRLPRVILRNYGAQALFAYRLGRSLSAASRDWRLAPLALLGWVLYFPLRAYARFALGIRLDLSAEIGVGCYIGHLGNIHLKRCKLGSYCSIRHSVQIMPAGDGPGPVIGDQVWIGSHARIIGPYSIGSGSTVSAAAVVDRNIPAKALCLGNPARVIARPYDNRKFLRLS